MKSKDLRLLLSISGSRTLFFASIFASVAWSAIVIAQGFLIANIIVGVIEQRPIVTERVIELSLLWLFKTFFQSQFERWTSSQALKVKVELRRRLVGASGNYTASPTEVSTLAIKGLNSLDIYVGRFLPQMIIAGSTPTAVIATLFLLDLPSALIALLTLPLIPIFGALIGKYTSDAVMKKWRELGTLAKYFEDSMRGFVTLRIFGRHRSQSERIADMGKRYTEETMKVLRISFLSALVLELCATISVALIAVSIGIRLVDGAIGFTDSLVILILAPEVYFPLRNAASLFHASADGAEAMNAIQKLLIEKKVGKRRTLEWERWRSDHLAIEIEGRTIHPSSALLLSGESGIGKTTFISDLLVNLDADSVAWIPQTPTLARGTLREQFLLLDSKMSDEEIVNICARVSLNVEELPHGLDTQLGGVGEKSSHASGGQVRKIAIARAFAKKAKLLIADEPTADLDAQSSRVIAELFESYVREGGALLLVSHDPLFNHLERIGVRYLDR